MDLCWRLLPAGTRWNSPSLVQAALTCSGLFCPILNSSSHQVKRRAEFLEVEVEPDGSFDDLLSNPVEAYQQVFGSVTREAGVADLDWKNHLFCQVSCLKSNMRRRYYLLPLTIRPSLLPSCVPGGRGATSLKSSTCSLTHF